MRRDRGVLAWVAIDVVTCLLLVVYTLIAPPVRPRSIETLGQYAVTITWPGASEDDVDLWVRAPDRTVVWFGSRDARTMYLEHDDIPTTEALYGPNHERVVVKSVQPGEYVVNTHLYDQMTPGPVTVEVRLYRIAGEDKLLAVKQVVLREPGEERTAFRFDINAGGRFAGTNDLPFALVGKQPSA